MPLVSFKAVFYFPYNIFKLFQLFEHECAIIENLILSAYCIISLCSGKKIQGLECLHVISSYTQVFFKH